MDKNESQMVEIKNPSVWAQTDDQASPPHSIHNFPPQFNSVSCAS